MGTQSNVPHHSESFILACTLVLKVPLDIAKIYHEFIEVSTSLFFRIFVLLFRGFKFLRMESFKRKVYIDTPQLELKITNLEPFSNPFLLSFKDKKP